MSSLLKLLVKAIIYIVLIGSLVLGALLSWIVFEPLAHPPDSIWNHEKKVTIDKDWKFVSAVWIDGGAWIVSLFP